MFLVPSWGIISGEFPHLNQGSTPGQGSIVLPHCLWARAWVGRGRGGGGVPPALPWAPFKGTIQNAYAIYPQLCFSLVAVCQPGHVQRVIGSGSSKLLSALPCALQLVQPATAEK